MTESTPPLKVALLGASGRMGRAIQELVAGDRKVGEQFELSYLGSSQNSDFASPGVQASDVLVDFSMPVATLKMAKVCAQFKIPMLVCTTGFNASEFEELTTILRHTPWVFAPNTSLGICALGLALKSVLRLLPPDFDLSVVEISHSEKKDAPSGTAKLLQKILLENSSRTEIPVLSIRGGTEPGEHKILMLGSAERLEFTHRASNRSLFARGALRLGKALSALPARENPYSVEEIFLLGTQK